MKASSASVAARRVDTHTAPENTVTSPISGGSLLDARQID
jgi:hypothetical protein